MKTHTKRRTLTAVLGIALLGIVVGMSSASARPFTAEDLVMMKRLSDPQPSPDGQWIAYTLRTTDLDANKGKTDLWAAPMDGSAAPTRLTTHPSSDGHGRWAPDGTFLYFLSSRSGKSQIWRLPSSGGEAQQVTDLPLDVGNLVVSPDGKHLAFSLEVFVDCADLQCTVDRLDKNAQSKATGKTYDRLFFRHWDTWKDGRRSHLFVLPANGEGAPIDVSAGLDADVPSKPFGGAEEITFTPDSQALVFAARLAGKTEPWSTNFDLYQAPIDGSKAPEAFTKNPAWDTEPVFSPDGTMLAYKAMERAGFEADRFRVVLRSWPDGKERILTDAWDRSVGGMFFSADGKTLYVTAQSIGQVGLFAVDVRSGKVRELLADGHVRSASLAGSRIVFGLDRLDAPVDLYSVALDGTGMRQITEVNKDLLSELEFGEYEQFHFKGWNNEKVYGFLVKPIDFDPAKTYPIAFLIHGGPQGSFDNDFHYRWNPQVYAGAGYAAIMIDFHGSTGYGQGFIDSIRADWGGKPLIDLQKGLAKMLEDHPWLDGDKACALGASYGGYMINWIAGNWSDRFRCLVNHDGVFDTRMMHVTTEELWFMEWEFRGEPWRSPEIYDIHNPAEFVENWKTPMLVIHGALDFRVPETQGFAAFTALQRQGIESELLYFPDENHWVLQPHNSLQWHESVLGWLGRYLGE